jgi:hypothetical protein
MSRTLLKHLKAEKARLTIHGIAPVMPTIQTIEGWGARIEQGQISLDKRNDTSEEMSQVDILKIIETLKLSNITRGGKYVRADVVAAINKARKTNPKAVRRYGSGNIPDYTYATLRKLDVKTGGKLFKEKTEEGIVNSRFEADQDPRNGIAYAVGETIMATPYFSEDPTYKRNEALVVSSFLSCLYISYYLSLSLC